MILNNMLAIIEAACTNMFNTNTGDIIGGSFPLRTPTKGTTPYYIANRYDYMNNFGTQGYLGKLHIVIGDDNTAPTIDDYQLGNKIGHIRISTSSQCSCYNGVQTFTGNWANDTGADVTVKEIGLANYIAATGLSSTILSTTQNTTSGNAKLSIVFIANDWFLLTRDVLDEPITIPDGETYTFTYKVDLSKMATNAE